MAERMRGENKMNNNGYGPFGQPMWTKEDYAEAEMEKMKFQLEHPEEYRKQQEERAKAREEAKKRIEAAKNLPQDYFDGWETYEVQKGDTPWGISVKLFGNGTRSSELQKNNMQQLPYGWSSIFVGMKLRVCKQEQKETPLGFDMICTGGPYGDCTCAYRLELKREYTIKEFVEEIVKKKPGEWGTIYHCKDLKKVYGTQLDTCDYSHGEITNYFSLIATGQQKIKEVIAHGGWTAMDYYIKTE